MKSNFTLLESELMEHKKLLGFFKPLPSDIKKLIQSFHRSRRPVLSCHECNKHYYQMCCFNKWVPWCRHHHAFPIHEEVLFFLDDY